jgi:putative ABC transport system permease protein
MVKELGLKNPIGKRIQNWQPYTVIGVVEDFHYSSMKEEIRPLCMVLGNSPSIISVKVNTADLPGLLASVTGLWKTFSLDQPIRYSFLDEKFAVMYKDVQRMGRVFSTFAVLAIVVACLGLFALSAFMVEQRGKEISIRLVLGASVNSILRLLSFNFLKLVLISFMIAVPIGWYLMKKWLEDYVYKTDLSPEIFGLAGLTAVVIALLTISYQSIRAALMKPVNNLKGD